MSTSARKFLDQFIKEHSEGNGYSDQLNSVFSDYLTESFSHILIENHEKKMSASEMAKHIKKLFNMCEDEKTEKKFLKRLGSAADVDDCSAKDIKKCSEALCKENGSKCDDLMDSLEGMVGYKDDDSEESEKDEKKEKKEKGSSKDSDKEEEDEDDDEDEEEDEDDK